MFEVYKMTRKGKVSKNFTPEAVCGDDVRKAFRKMDVTFAGFKTVPNTSKLKTKANSWFEYVEMVWELAIRPA